MIDTHFHHVNSPPTYSRTKPSTSLCCFTHVTHILVHRSSTNGFNHFKNLFSDFTRHGLYWRSTWHFFPANHL